MKNLIIILTLLWTIPTFATDTDVVLARTTESTQTAGQLIDLLNQVLTAKAYTAFSSIPTSGEDKMNVTLNSWTVSIRIVYSSSSVTIPAGLPSAGSSYSNRVTIYANNHNIDLGCGVGDACVIIDFDSTLKRGHTITTSYGTGANDPDGVEYFNSLVEVFYDNSVTGTTYITSKMLDLNPGATTQQFILNGYRKVNGVVSYIATPTVVTNNAVTLALTDFCIDLPTGSSGGQATTLFGLH